MNRNVSRRSAWHWFLPAALPCIAILFIPSFDSPFLGAKTTFLLIIGAVAVFGLRSDGGVIVFPEKFFQWTAIFWIAAFTFSMLFAHNWMECWHSLTLFAAAAIFFAAIVRQKISVQALLWAIFVSAVVVSLVAISGHFGYDLPRFFMHSAAPGRMRTASTLGNPLFVASFLPCAIWAVFVLPAHNLWRGILAVIVLVGMVVTSERTAILAFATGVIVFSLLGRNTSRHGMRTRTTILIAIFLFVFAAKFSVNPRSFTTTMHGRIFLWKTALHHIKFFGNGPGSFYRIYNQNLREIAPTIPPDELHFVNYETNAYNIFVQTTVEEGVLGLIALLAFFAAWFRLAWPTRKSDIGHIAIAAVATFLATGLSDDPLTRPEGIALLAVWLAVPVLARDNPAVFEIESSRLGLRSSLPFFVPVISLLLLLAAGITAFTNYAVHQGEQAEKHGDWAQAERWNRAALRFDPAERDAHFNLVRDLAQQHKYEASFAESEKALYWVNEAELHIIRVRILPMLGKTQQAQEELIQAQKEFPWSEALQQEAMPGQ